VVPAPRPAKRTRRVAPISAPPAAPAFAPAATATPAHATRFWQFFPAPHLLIGAGLLLMIVALNIPWGVTGDGTLLYARSFSIPYLSTGTPDLAAQVAQNIVSGVAALSIVLVALNYFLKFVNALTKPVGCAGAGTCLLMPAMILLVLILIGIDGGALIFGAFDPLAGVPAWPWQSGFSLHGAHDELGFYAWYTGIVLNLAGGFSQPFVRR
jgi:hypothetical protein